jgi:threonine synthase
MRLTARRGGVFGEPAGVTGVAGLKKAVGQSIVKPDESAVVVITGNGLKDIHSAKQAVGQAIDIDPEFDKLESCLKDLDLL